MISIDTTHFSRLKYLAIIEMGQSPPSSEYSYSADEGLPFLQGTADFGAKYPAPRVYCNTPSKVAQPNDILLSVRAPVGGLNVADQRYGIGRGLCAIRCQNQLQRGFAWWLLHWVREQLAFEATGSTYDAVTVDDVANLPIPLPSLKEQRAIAAYLDRETAKLDALIAALGRLLDLLAEKRRALITHAVTRGLHLDAPLRDSGVEWLGKIPEHWEVEFARRLFKEADERSITSEEELLTVSHLTGVTPRSEKNVNMFMAESTQGYKICQRGDLVINTLWAWMGAMGVAFQKGIVSPSYHVYRPLGHYEPRYIDYLVRIPIFATEVNRYSKGVWSSRLRLYPEGFFQISLPVPPLEEQHEITDYLALETAKLDRLIGIAQKTIELFQERRNALIAAAVTGKHPVTE